MNNYRGPGGAVTIPAPSALVAGQFFKYAGAVFVAAHAASIGADVVALKSGVFAFASTGAGLPVYLSSAGALNTGGQGDRVGVTLSLTSFLFDAEARGGASEISPRYRFFIPAKQFPTSGAPKDYSANSADAALLAGLTDAAAWANSGYLTTAAGANGGAKVPKVKTEFDLATDSIIFSAVMLKASPAGADVVFAIGDAGASQGLYLSVRPGGRLRPVINTSGSVGGAVVSGLADSAAIFADNTPHAVMLAVDAVTKAVYLYRDGALSDTYLNAYAGGTPSRATDMYLGASAGGTALESSRLTGLHFLVIPNAGLPSNLSEIANRLAATPHLPLTDMVIR